MKAIVLFVGCAALSAAVQIALTSCAEDECACPVMPRFPQEIAALPISEAINYDHAGNHEGLPFGLEDGTIEVTGHQVVVRYDVEGSEREVVYKILPGN